MKKLAMSVTVCMAALASAGCSSDPGADEHAPASVVQHDTTIAEQLGSEGFEVDPSRAPVSRVLRNQQVTAAFYKDHDGRAAVLLRTTAGELGGVIYDPATKTMLKKLEATSNVAIGPKSGCGEAEWTDWNTWYSWTWYADTCYADGTGYLCHMSCNLLMECSEGCDVTACTCVIAN